MKIILLENTEKKPPFKVNSKRVERYKRYRSPVLSYDKIIKGFNSTQKDTLKG
jgi:hypothetical protein